MGLAGWLVYVIDRLLDRSSGGRSHFYVLRFYAQPVPPNRLVPERPNDPLKIAPIDRRALDPTAFGRPLEAIKDRFDDGSVCIAALKGQELLGFMWLQAGVLRERIVRCRMRAIPSNRVEWDYDFFIQPRYRLGRLFGRLWDVAAQNLRDRNIEATVSWVHLGNRASAKAHARLGAEPIGWAVFFALFGHQLLISSMRPKFAYSPPNKTLDLYVDVSRALPSRSPTPPSPLTR